MMPYFARSHVHCVADSNLPMLSISLLDDEDWSKLTRLYFENALPWGVVLSHAVSGTRAASLARFLL